MAAVAPYSPPLLAAPALVLLADAVTACAPAIPVPDECWDEYDEALEASYEGGGGIDADEAGGGGGRSHCDLPVLWST